MERLDHEDEQGAGSTAPASDTDVVATMRCVHCRGIWPQGWPGEPCPLAACMPGEDCRHCGSCGARCEPAPAIAGGAPGAHVTIDGREYEMRGIDAVDTDPPALQEGSQQDAVERAIEELRTQGWELLEIIQRTGGPWTWLLDRVRDAPATDAAEAEMAP